MVFGKTGLKISHKKNYIFLNLRLIELHSTMPALYIRYFITSLMLNKPPEFYIEYIFMQAEPLAQARQVRPSRRANHALQKICNFFNFWNFDLKLRKRTFE